jgi:hypothetical protein
MRGPKQVTGTSDRVLECQRDLELNFLNFMAEALTVGWSHAQVCLAMMNLTDNHVLAQAVGTHANEELLRVLASRPKTNDGLDQKDSGMRERHGR